MRVLPRGKLPERVAKVERFEARHEAVSVELAPRLGNHLVRDALYLNWRYLDAPRPYQAVETAAGGYSVVGETVRRGRRVGLVMELVAERFQALAETNRLQIHPQPIRWIEFIERRATAFRIQNPGRTINFAKEAEETIVNADPDRMRQVIDNLLSNAIKYSPDGTAIEVIVRPADSEIETSVIDHGIGIPRDEIPQLFERFHRARNVSSRYYGGLGLGLYIAKAIVEAHRGSISVESEEGRGSAFTVTLPMADA